MRSILPRRNWIELYSPLEFLSTISVKVVLCKNIYDDLLIVISFM